MNDQEPRAPDGRRPRTGGDVGGLGPVQIALGLLGLFLVLLVLWFLWPLLSGG